MAENFLELLKLLGIIFSKNEVSRLFQGQTHQIISFHELI